jgi:transposase
VVAVVRAAFLSLTSDVVALRAEVAELRHRLALDSRTSSKPPSTDRTRAHRRVQSLRERSGRRPGAQPGHTGRTLAWCAEPDHVVVHVPVWCGGCGRAFDAAASHAPPLAGLTTGPADAVRVLERAQVIDLPPVRLTVTEHERLALTCPHCGVESAGTFTDELQAGVQYGPGVRAFAVALHSYHLLPYARTAECLDGLFGRGPSAGSIATWVRTAAHRLTGEMRRIAEAVQRADAAHADETGLHVARQRGWVHVGSTATHAHYHVDWKRGRVGINAGGLWTEYMGALVHDGWWPYGTYGAARHQLCLAHLIREARGLYALTIELGQPEAWLRGLDHLLTRLHRLVRRAAAAGRPALAPRTIRRLTTTYERLLAQARRRHPYPRRGTNLRRGRPQRGPIAAFADRLIRSEADVLRCASDTRIPPDNNEAERDLRMVKVAEKITGGFRTLAGAQQFCVLRSVLRTGRKQGRAALTILRDVFDPTPQVSVAPSC